MATMYPKVIPVVLSGGNGSRLWPLSRKRHPKPFIKLNDGESLLQKTYRRANEYAGTNEVIIVTNRDLFFYSKDECEAVRHASAKITFLLEPVGRNTAAAIAMAAHYAKSEFGDDCVLLVMPADHLIEDLESFTQAVGQAKALALGGALVTFGLSPTVPRTDYGYILTDGNKVKSFIEKPDKKNRRIFC